VRDQYEIQRLIYALAALRTGAARVEVGHLFLERPHDPVSATYSRNGIQSLERELLALAGGALRGEFPVSEEPWAGLCAGCPGENGLCRWPLELTRRGSPSPAAAPCASSELQGRLF